MNIYEIMRYAQDKNKEVEFQFVNLKGETIKCKTLDCHLGFFQINNMNGFIRDNDWHNNLGESIQFELINEV